VNSDNGKSARYSAIAVAAERIGYEVKECVSNAVNSFSNFGKLSKSENHFCEE